jgi:thiamine transporter
MNTNNKALTRVLKLCECALAVALAIILDLLSKLLTGGMSDMFWPGGGGITIGMVPLVFIAYRHGDLWGILTAFVYSGVQLVTGWYAPPAGTLLSFVLCILLDYVLAFTVLGLSNFFAKFFKNKLFGYGFGAFCVCMLRFVCSFLSGAILWGDWIAWEGFSNPWIYSLLYNGSYMLPNAIITAAIIVALCGVFDPKTLKRVKNAK